MTGRAGGVATATASASGVGFGGLLAVAFIVLRLCGVIAWSWWWILAPIWIPVSAVVLLLLIGAVGWLVVARAQGRDRERRLRATAGVAQATEPGPRHRWGMRP